eukprot:m.227399 g.227399  ORF g.227399 m.227399 type:complete len:93 (-) comp33519_c1_seq5:212-490(-)
MVAGPAVDVGLYACVGRVCGFVYGYVLVVCMGLCVCVGHVYGFVYGYVLIMSVICTKGFLCNQSGADATTSGRVECYTSILRFSLVAISIHK